MKTLRDPEKGCPWDKKQTIDSIGPYTLEEVYEVLDSLENKDMDSLCNELGDLLFHIVFYAEMASEQGYFDFNDVAEQVSAKLRRRHPHVFTDKKLESNEELIISWEAIKKKEREAKTKHSEKKAHLLDDIGSNMPAIMRAHKLQLRAASVDFDWQTAEPVIAKIEEELQELKAELYSTAKPEKLSEEMGDLLFSCINLARHIKVEAESSLRQSNRKFEQRFRFIEEQLGAQGLTLQQASAQQMEIYWQAAKDNGI